MARDPYERRRRRRRKPWPWAAKDEYYEILELAGELQNELKMLAPKIFQMRNYPLLEMKRPTLTIICNQIIAACGRFDNIRSRRTAKWAGGAIDKTYYITELILKGLNDISEQLTRRNPNTVMVHRRLEEIIGLSVKIIPEIEAGPAPEPPEGEDLSIWESEFDDREGGF